MEWNKLVPELVVADYRASRRFYTEVLGFTLFFERTEDRFGYFDLDGAQIMLIEQPGGDLYGLRPDTEKGAGCTCRSRSSASPRSCRRCSGPGWPWRRR